MAFVRTQFGCPCARTTSMQNPKCPTAWPVSPLRSSHLPAQGLHQGTRSRQYNLTSLVGSVCFTNMEGLIVVADAQDVDLESPECVCWTPQPASNFASANTSHIVSSTQSSPAAEGNEGIAPSRPVLQGGQRRREAPCGAAAGTAKGLWRSSADCIHAAGRGSAAAAASCGGIGDVPGQPGATTAPAVRQCERLTS